MKLRDMMCDVCQGWGQVGLAGDNGTVDCLVCEGWGCKPEYIEIVRAVEVMRSEITHTLETGVHPKPDIPEAPLVTTHPLKPVHLGPVTMFRLHNLVNAERGAGRFENADMIEATANELESTRRQLRDAKAINTKAANKVLDAWLKQPNE